MPMLPNGQVLPYGPQSGRAPFQPPGAAPGAGADLQALLGSPQLATAIQEGGIDDPMAKIRQTIAAVGARSAAPGMPPAGNGAMPGTGMVDPKAAGAPLVRPAQGPLSGGSFPVRMRPGSTPGAPAAAFPSSAMFRARQGY